MCLIKTIKLNKLERYYITNILEEDKVVIKILYKDIINKFFFKKYDYYSPYENYKYIKNERFFGKLKRSFYVGYDFKKEQVEASYVDGILKIVLPKLKPEEKAIYKFFI